MLSACAFAYSFFPLVNQPSPDRLTRDHARVLKIMLKKETQKLHAQNMYLRAVYHAVRTEVLRGAPMSNELRLRIFREHAKGYEALEPQRRPFYEAEAEKDAGKKQAEISELLALTAAQAPPEQMEELQERVSALEGKNADMRSELSAFDPDFFEEIEQLKYEHHQLTQRCSEQQRTIALLMGEASGGSA